MDFLKVRSCLILGMIVMILCDGEFECPTKADCTCSRGINGDYELLCPRGPGINALSINVQPTKYMTIQCRPHDKSSLNFLTGLQIGVVKDFMLSLCPLPNVSFKELMSTAGIPSVKTLIVQSHNNLSNTLTKEHLEGLSQVSQINLASNSLTEIPEDLFQSTVNLTWLDMKNNNLKLPKGIFRPVPKLEVLELGANKMKYLEPGIFRNLTKLRLLNLWGNRLQNLSRSLFTDLSNLENLDLNNNGLVTLPPDIFADLGKLRNLNLNGNEFQSLPQGLFLGTTNLEKVQIQTNRRSLHAFPSGFLSNLTHLKDAFLNDLDLEYIPEDLIWGCVLLMTLNLQKNQLQDLPPLLLKDNRELVKINLSYNKIISIPDKFFYSQEQLLVLDLQKNQIETISNNVFSKLLKLETISLNDNEIEYIGPGAFQTTVKLLNVDLSGNRLTVFSADQALDLAFGPQSLLQSVNKLEILKLARNNISMVYSDWQISMTNLIVLDLSYNQLYDISIEDLQFLSARVTLDLSYNNISRIRLERAEDLARNKFDNTQKKDELQKNSARVILRGNPLQCDCKAYHLVKFLRGELDPIVEYIADLDSNNFTCNGPSKFKNQMVRSIDPKTLTCNINEVTNCPKNCTCLHRPADNALVVDCSYQNLTQIPLSLPNNNLTLEITNHTELDLTGNRIKSLPHILGQGYERVNELKIRENNLKHINISILSPNIEILLMDNNNLSTIDVDSLKRLEKATQLKQISLHQNPWNCDCTVKELMKFLHRKYKVVSDYENLTCSSGIYFSNMTESDLCPRPIGIDIGIGLLILAIFGFLICAMFVLYYKYQIEIKVWLYSRGWCLWFVTEEELDKDKVYDAFISYSHQDENFILEKLVPGLENGTHSYKLCLHYRDWIVGDFIPNQIARSVEESRRTIVILSPNFIESVWGKMEFRAAHSKALSEGRARVIVVLYGDLVDTDQLDPELAAYLSMNTYVKWGDPWFWEKIRYAMPHPPKSKIIPLKREKLVKGSLELNMTTPPSDVITDTLKKSH